MIRNPRNLNPILLTALLAMTMGPAAAAADDPGGPATFAEALELAKQQDKPLVLDFYTDW